MRAGPAQAPPPHPPLRARSPRSLRAQPQPHYYRCGVALMSGGDGAWFMTYKRVRARDKRRLLHHTRLDREAAATLRELSFDPVAEKHGESDVSEPLAEVAAAIGGELHEQAESIEFGASARMFPPAHRNTSLNAITQLTVGGDRATGHRFVFRPPAVRGTTRYHERRP